MHKSLRLIFQVFVPFSFPQKIELGWKSFLCGPLRISAFSAVNGPFNAEGRRDTQRPQRKQISFATCAKPCRFLAVARVAFL